MLKSFLQKWTSSAQDRMGLDILLGQAPLETAPLRDRLNWMRQLVHWVRAPGPFGSQKMASLPSTRMKFIFRVLEQNPAMKTRVAGSLRSIIQETQALELFMNVGIPNDQSFLGECMERMHLKLLPQAPRDRDLISAFSQTFRYRGDAEWIRNLDSELFRSWMELYLFGTSNRQWNTLLQDMRDAMLLLSRSVSSMGVSRLVRNRVNMLSFRELAFFELPTEVEELLATENADETTRVRTYQKVHQTLLQCRETLDKVHVHFRTEGVSIALVYQVERLRALIGRLDTLCQLFAHTKDPALVQKFFSLLVEENYRARSIRGFVSDNIVLICQKIVDTNAETGEHYISRDRDEHHRIIKAAAGGGLVTGFTCWIKLFLHHLEIAPFVWGFLASANYAISFVIIQLLGFSLATKQPAMTATALANRLDAESDRIGPLIEEIVHLLRSQIATVFGNLVTVIPMVLLIDFALNLMGHHIIDAKYAVKVIDGFSLLGPTPLFAAWTGVLLWASSVFSGLFANWFSFRGLPAAIEHHPRLVYVFGVHRTRQISGFVHRNIAGFAANISLGFLLGMSLPIGSFFGIAMDVRHVTLSTGQMTAACAVLGTSVFTQGAFWLAIGGLLSMAVLNLAVSFALALIVAIWARKTNTASRRVIYQELVKRLLSQPWILFFAPRKLETT